MTLQEIQNSENLIWENIYDFEFFFYIAPNASYHVKCKLLSHSSIINILNKKIYGIDFDINELNRKYIMDLHQKKNLILNLKQILREQILYSGIVYNSEILTIPELRSNKLELFYQPLNDVNFYRVICNGIHDDVNDDNNDDYDFEFFNHDFTRYVTCKLLSHTSIINILNKEIYGTVFDENGLKHKYNLSEHQKLDLELNLERDLPVYLDILEILNEGMGRRIPTQANSNYRQ
ncbi:hypothetical protein RclHR1_02010008 [Rhizophagus clarus]|uniref:Uncharacterized protein n=1 Tax=Rhizophagus clarus TaxID=94130 RepID=A0A2Z6R668_9GLOM|nr:hypothetical protein RclHR1_02010008 [Rhizophagus clarus]GET03276.1 hypothetical protein GLOIN_2v1875698 [Rhizophagus clarus]